jgi:hypothetical protein
VRYLNKQEKQNFVIKLLNEGCTYREIQKRARVTPNFISEVEKEKFGKQNIISNSTPKLSKNSKAMKLFCNNNKPMEVALALDMNANEVNKSYSDFMRLSDLNSFSELINEENKEKLILMLKVVETFNKNGITNIDMINNVLIEIKYHKNIKHEINHFSKILDDIKIQIIILQNEIDDKIRIIKRKNVWIRFLKSKVDELKKEIEKKEELVDELQRLSKDIYDMEAIEQLQNKLIDNIENVILEKDQQLILILVAVFEAYKEDPQKRKLLDQYCTKFWNKKLSVDNIEERTKYLNSNEFWNDIPSYFTKLSEVYSKAVFAFILKNYYQSYKHH